jgi:hypothetical protein
MILELLVAGTLASAPHGDTEATAPMADTQRVSSPAQLAALVAKKRVPSFARQLRLSCGVCHVGFPELTWFGRMFKLNGYALSGLEPIVEQLDSASRRTLALTPIPAMSVSALVSSTSVGKALPGTPATRSEYPQQLSMFWAGQVSPNIGALLQLTYSDVGGRIGMDVSDIRYARHAKVNNRDVILGVTLHNTPTGQDVWNTLPAWSFPFVSPALAPRPATSTLIEGALAQQVIGLGAYTLFDQTLYAEVTGYTSAPQGPRAVQDSTETNLLGRVAPYWRIGVQRTIRGTYAMLGTFGMSADMYPRGVFGQPNHFNDYGFDLQLERPIARSRLIGRANWIHEDQSLLNAISAVPRTAQNVSNTLTSMHANATLAMPVTSFTLGWFSTKGSADNLRYAAGPVTGSSNGRPDTSGEIGEVVLNRWLNSRIGLQYVVYDTFNGSSSAYDVRAAGSRNARDNNALYIYVWLAF